ncbi:MAG: hypothetical protein VX426_07590 [Chloroflexota bacterium]|nr:hypothetical protein [Chloroflexota bacterium]
MPRGLGNILAFLEGYKLFSEGMSQREIQEYLAPSYSSRSYPSMRTVGNWITQYKAIAPHDQEESGTVEWNRLEEMGFGWEVSRGLETYYRRHQKLPTKRTLKWWYRLSQLGDWEDGELADWATRYEEHEVRALFGLEPEKLSELDRKMLSQRSR